MAHIYLRVVKSVASGRSGAAEKRTLLRSLIHLGPSSYPVNGHLGEVGLKIGREPGRLLKVGKQELQATSITTGSSTRGTAIVLVGQFDEAWIQALRALLISIGDFHKIRQRVLFSSPQMPGLTHVVVNLRSP